MIDFVYFAILILGAVGVIHAFDCAAYAWLRYDLKDRQFWTCWWWKVWGEK